MLHNVLPDNFQKLDAKGKTNSYLNMETNTIINFPRVGAFEVTVYGVLIFSKLQCGLWPSAAVICNTIKQMKLEHNKFNFILDESKYSVLSKKSTAQRMKILHSENVEVGDQDTAVYFMKLRQQEQIQSYESLVKQQEETEKQHRVQEIFDKLKHTPPILTKKYQSQTAQKQPGTIFSQQVRKTPVKTVRYNNEENPLFPQLSNNQTKRSHEEAANAPNSDPQPKRHIKKLRSSNTHHGENLSGEGQKQGRPNKKFVARVKMWSPQPDQKQKLIADNSRGKNMGVDNYRKTAQYYYNKYKHIVNNNYFMGDELGSKSGFYATQQQTDRMEEDPDAQKRAEEQQAHLFSQQQHAQFQPDNADGPAAEAEPQPSRNSD